MYTNGAAHNNIETNRTGKVGVDTLAQREAVIEKLSTCAVARPRGPLFALRCDPFVADAGLDLSMVQNYKKNNERPDQEVRLKESRNPWWRGYRELKGSKAEQEAEERKQERRGE